MKDNIYICRMGDRSSGKIQAFAVQLNKIANERRDLFIEDLERELKLSLNSNILVYNEHRKKYLISGIYENPLLECVRGKIEALRGILDFIEEQKKLFTYHDTDSTGEEKTE